MKVKKEGKEIHDDKRVKTQSLQEDSPIPSGHYAE